MNAVLVLSLFCALSASAGPVNEIAARIAHGQDTTIDSYPFAAALLTAQDGISFTLRCGGAIINNRSILTAAFCFVAGNNQPSNVRVRVGSSLHASGGSLHDVATIIRHPNYDVMDETNDLAIVHVRVFFSFSDTVQQVPIASYSPNAGEVVTAIGWGVTEHGQNSEQLRHVNLYIVSRDSCNEHYSGHVTNDMICTAADFTKRPSRLICTRDTGSPQIHQGAVFGISSWGSYYCGDREQPAVSTLVANYASWIVSNA